MLWLKTKAFLGWAVRRDRGRADARRGEDGSQADWAQGNRDDREDTNEDGGDILDEPHGDPREDAEDGGDAEESMGWSNPMGWRIGDPAPEGMFGPGGD